MDIISHYQVLVMKVVDLELHQWYGHIMMLVMQQWFVQQQNHLNITKLKMYIYLHQVLDMQQ